MNMVEVTRASLSEDFQGNIMSNGNETDSKNLANISQEMKEKTDGSNFIVDEFCNGDRCHDGAHEKLIEMVAELKFQNEYLKAQFEGLKLQFFESSEAFDCKSNVGIEQEESDIIKELSMKIESLTKELKEQRQLQLAAEDALNHLRLSYSESDTKAQELSAELTRVQQKMNQEIKDRDEKNVDLESKVSRLHKRAKQKIQELQKEKDDIESRFKDLSETVEKTASEKLLLQQELDRSRQHAADALRSMDVDRQQIRTVNSKLRENNDELCRSLGEKEKALEEFRQSLIEKEQVIEETRRLLESANEKRDSSIADLIAKHQKHLESLEGQLADAVSERSKAAETISSLQALIVEKESEIAELEAASTGEAVRLRAYIDAVKGELNQCKQEYESEKENWDASYQVLKKQLEMAENQCLQSEIESEKMRSKLETELSVQSQMLNSMDSELATAREEINRLESEFSSYKARAHALLQKKDAELVAANEKLIKAREEALKEMEKELEFAEAEKNKALQDLHAAHADIAELLAEKDAATLNMIQQIKQLETKLESTNTHYILEKEEWQRALENVENSWRIKYEAIEAENKEHQGIDLQKELDELKLQYIKLQGEHSSFRDIADKIIEEKDNEISRLLSDKKNLRQSMESQSLVQNNGNQNSAFLKQDSQASTIEAAEQQILLLARQQAQREEQLSQSQRHILALQEEIEELERENRLHSQQQAMLKAELREMERSRKREGVDMTYLKNVVLKLLETGEVEALLPVVGMLLQFSPEEIRRCQQSYNSSSSGPPSSNSDNSASGPSSLFSRFTFT